MTTSRERRRWNDAVKSLNRLVAGPLAGGMVTFAIVNASMQNYGWAAYDCIFALWFGLAHWAFWFEQRNGEGP